VICKYCMAKFETRISITLGKNEHSSSIMRIARHELAFCTCVTNARNLSCISQDLPFARLVYNHRCFHYLKSTKKEFSDWMLLQYSHLTFSFPNCLTAIKKSLYFHMTNKQFNILTFWKCLRTFLRVIFITTMYSNLHYKIIALKLQWKLFFLFLIKSI